MAMEIHPPVIAQDRIKTGNYLDLREGEEKRETKISGAPEGSFQPYTVSVQPKLDTVDSLSSGLPRRIAEQIAVEGVESVYLLPDEKAMRFLVVIPRRDPDLRTRIHMVEYGLLRH